MNFHARVFIATSATLAFTSLSFSAGAALVQYNYTGNPFTTISSPPGDAYPPTHVNINFTVDESLLPKNGHAILLTNDYSDTWIPFSFNFSFGQNYQIDSVGFYDNGRPGAHNDSPSIYRNVRIEFDTNADGQLKGNWYAAVYKSSEGRAGFYVGISISSSSNGLTPIEDKGEHLIYWGTPDSSGLVANNPGTWTRSLAPVPLPGGILLFGSGIGCLCLSRRRVSGTLTVFKPHDLKADNDLSVSKNGCDRCL